MALRSIWSQLRIVDTTMEALMLEDCLAASTEAMERFEGQHEAAAFIKQRMDFLYQPT